MVSNELLLPFRCQNWGCQLVKKENFPLVAGIIGTLIITFLKNVDTRTFPISDALAYFLFFLSFGLVVPGSIIGILFLLRKNYRPGYRPIVILCAVLSVCVMGFQTFLMLMLFLLANFGI